MQVRPPDASDDRYDNKGTDEAVHRSVEGRDERIDTNEELIPCKITTCLINVESEKRLKPYNRKLAGD